MCSSSYLVDNTLFCYYSFVTGEGMAYFCAGIASSVIWFFLELIYIILLISYIHIYFFFSTPVGGAYTVFCRGMPLMGRILLCRWGRDEYDIKHECGIK